MLQVMRFISVARWFDAVAVCVTLSQAGGSFVWGQTNQSDWIIDAFVEDAFYCDYGGGLLVTPVALRVTFENGLSEGNLLIPKKLVSSTVRIAANSDALARGEFAQDMHVNSVFLRPASPQNDSLPLSSDFVLLAPGESYSTRFGFTVAYALPGSDASSDFMTAGDYVVRIDLYSTYADRDWRMMDSLWSEVGEIMHEAHPESELSLPAAPDFAPDDECFPDLPL